MLTIKAHALLSKPHRFLQVISLIASIMIIIGGCRRKQTLLVTPQMDADQCFWVRVLLLKNVAACKLTINSPFVILEDEKSNPLSQPLQNQYLPCKTIVKISDGKLTLAGKPFRGGQVVICPGPPHIFDINADTYRGRLKLIVSPDGNRFDVINLVPLEPYLAGVVGAEMHHYWEPEALKAQAIAARTYCLYIKRRFGGSRTWDVRKTQASQVYQGLSAESEQIWTAVNKTTGQVLVCKYNNGTEDIFPAYYSSTCGGHTENSDNVFGSDTFPALPGVPCPYCKYVAKPANFFWKMVQFDKNRVSEKLLARYPNLKKLGEITGLAVANQTDYENFSRLTSIKLTGSTGKEDFLRAEDLRLIIDPTGKKIKSTCCRILDMGDKWAFFSGRGFGHGVGMCQSGAQAMAKEGKNAKHILSYYYPNSRIEELY